jgi:enamidase
MSLAVINIGTIASGDLDQPLLRGDCVLVEDGKISAIGGADQLNANSADTVIDANGATVLPGLIDSHFHVAIGDYQPRQKVVDFIDSYTHGGVTSMISAGEIHTPGRPNDAAGVKALAILAQRSYSNLHPNGAKVHAGAVVLEPTLREKDFEELAAEGIWLAKFGFGDYSDPYDGESQIRWAQKNGIKVMCHSGGASIPGSTAISATHLLQLKPDICGHVNGGPTSLDNDGLRRLVSETDLYLQLVQAGNLRSSLFILGLVQEHDGMGRVVVGSDTPTGTGMMPLGVVKTITELSSLGRLPAATALCLATGNNAKAWGLNSGIIAPGRDADLLIADAPNGSTRDNMFSAMENGDVPGIGVVIIDSVIRVFRSRNSPPPAKVPRILKQPTPSLPSF